MLAEMLIIGFGVTEVLLLTLVFSCETCGNPRRRSADQADPQVLTFFIPLFIEISKEQAETASRQVGQDLR